MRIAPIRSTLLLAALAGLASARQPVRARHAMVVSQEQFATEAGVRALRAGGNAIDAAITVGFALAVTYPAAGNLGGGGFMLVRLADGRTAFLDFRERAPEKASRDMYLDASGKITNGSIEGWRAPGVPGTVRGLEHAHRKWSRKPWAELVAPAIDLARNGFPMPYELATSLGRSKRLARFPESSRIFQHKGIEPGERLVQSDLARTLERIARDGARDFYEGETARILAREMAAKGGLITLADLRNYTVREREPLRGRYGDYDIFTAPPPSSGGIGLLQMLGMLEGSGYEKPGQGAAATIHFVTEVMRRYYADRAEHFADPDFHRVPVSALLDPAYIARRRESIDPERATPSDTVRPGSFASAESAETTHYSVVDSEGNAVAVTYTLNGSYGSGVTVPGLGVLLNNEMDDFAAKPGMSNMFGLVQGEANAIAPGKRPLSSMTPTIVLRNGRLFLVYGGPGGGRIITSVLQVFLNIVDFGLNVQDAIDRPRFHHQWKPDRITLEPGFSPDTIRLLERRGHTVEVAPPASRIEAILIDGGWLQGAADGRGLGAAQGY
ncbi:MAG TPA: gamma-glutamyltransferase [Bryobacteraceae bacterium]|nr:gamma-glutamyltransferase [Bryobacteraceae bacterium]